jgi:hypothetical protein
VYKYAKIEKVIGGFVLKPSLPPIAETRVQVAPPKINAE